MSGSLDLNARLIDKLTFFFFFCGIIHYANDQYTKLTFITQAILKYSFSTSNRCFCELMVSLKSNKTRQYRNNVINRLRLVHAPPSFPVIKGRRTKLDQFSALIAN